MSRETREIRRIDDQEGTLTDKAGKTAKVRFSLVQTEDFIDEVAMLRSASGTLEFESRSEAWAMTESGENKTLKGGGIQAEVLVISIDSFRVTGAIKDI